MIVSIIAAMDTRRGIGVDGALPWRLSADLQRFKRLTMGHHLILGRKTYESIGRPLPGRQMVVITRQTGFAALGVQVVHSLDEALEVARRADEDEAFIGGGGQIYRQALPYTDRMYLTLVHAAVEADVFFPPYDPGAWDVLEEAHYEPDEKNAFPTTFCILKRRNP